MDALVGFGSPAVVLLWTLALLIVVAWFVRQQQRKCLVTVLFYVVLLWFLAPILVQYPFTFSPINIAATGPDAFASYVPVIDRAFLICLLGMVSFAVGFSWTRSRPSFPLIQHIFLGLKAWSVTPLLWLTGLAILSLLMLLVLTGLGSHEGLRGAAMLAPAYRPFLNFALTALPRVIGLILLVAVEKRRSALIILLLLLLLFAALTGSRGSTFGGIATYIGTVLTYRSVRRELSLVQMLALIPAGFLLLFLIVLLGDIRSGQTNILITGLNFGRRLFYGNNFSDLRDFAWILAYWDGHYFWGRTQLAGILGFIPSVLFPLRSRWGWGRKSVEITGLALPGEPTTHPGLRPGVFGEWYLNFGLPGVIIAGVLLGYVTRRLHAVTVAAVGQLPPFEAKLWIYASYLTLGLFFNFLITSAFFSVYATLLILESARVAKYLLRLTTTIGVTQGARFGPATTRADT